MRKTIVNHCLNLCQNSVFTKEQTDRIFMLNQRLSVICNWEMSVRRATRCRFIYWQRTLYPNFLQTITSNQYRLNQMNYYLMAL